MKWTQKEIVLKPKPRGFNLVTSEVVGHIPELGNYRVGIAHFFVKHTSASLTLNENADPTVRSDLEAHFSEMVPENAPYFVHTTEGPDDMPAHVKSSLLGSGVTVPITDGRLNLGTWQGIYLCEHRNRAGNRRVVVTLWGETI